MARWCENAVRIILTLSACRRENDGGVVHNTAFWPHRNDCCGAQWRRRRRCNEDWCRSSSCRRRDTVQCSVVAWACVRARVCDERLGGERERARARLCVIRLTIYRRWCRLNNNNIVIIILLLYYCVGRVSEKRSATAAGPGRGDRFGGGLINAVRRGRLCAANASKSVFNIERPFRFGWRRCVSPYYYPSHLPSDLSLSSTVSLARHITSSRSVYSVPFIHIYINMFSTHDIIIYRNDGLHYISYKTCIYKYIDI